MLGYCADGAAFLLWLFRLYCWGWPPVLKRPGTDILLYTGACLLVTGNDLMASSLASSCGLEGHIDYLLDKRKHPIKAYAVEVWYICLRQTHYSLDSS